MLVNAYRNVYSDSIEIKSYRTDVRKKCSSMAGVRNRAVVDWGEQLLPFPYKGNCPHHHQRFETAEFRG